MKERVLFAVLWVRDSPRRIPPVVPLPGIWRIIGIIFESLNIQQKESWKKIPDFFWPPNFSSDRIKGRIRPPTNFEWFRFSRTLKNPGNRKSSSKVFTFCRRSIGSIFDRLGFFFNFLQYRNGSKLVLGPNSTYSKNWEESLKDWKVGNSLFSGLR